MFFTSLFLCKFCALAIFWKTFGDYPGLVCTSKGDVSINWACTGATEPELLSRAVSLAEDWLSGSWGRWGGGEPQTDYKHMQTIPCWIYLVRGTWIQEIAGPIEYMEREEALARFPQLLGSMTQGRIGKKGGGNIMPSGRGGNHCNAYRAPSQNIKCKFARHFSNQKSKQAGDQPS